MTEIKRNVQDQPSLAPERYIQAKTFLDNGVITEEQFLEMTRGQANLEEENDSHILAKMQKTILDIDARLRRMEIMLTKLSK